jgi:hypothetical protein
MNTYLFIILAIIFVSIIAAIITLQPSKEKAIPAPPPVTHQVTLYSNGEVMKTIRATYADTTEGYGYARSEDANDETCFGGCFVIEEIDKPQTTLPTRSSKFKVTLFDGGKIVREWSAAYAYGTEGIAYLDAEDGASPALS